MTFENIRLVARYERNLIIRNKLFWIFACCVVAGISLSHWLWQSDSLGGLRWLNRALPSFIPFWNAWFYNLVQGIIVIFIGIDFVWRDRRLETNAVFSARPVTNLAYQTGKEQRGQGHHEQVNKINLQLESSRFPEQDMENHP